MSSAAQHFYFETKIHLNCNSVFFTINYRNLFPVQNYSQTSEENFLEKIAFHILSVLCNTILIQNKMAAFDRWSQNNSDLFGKFNCMYQYTNTFTNLNIEPKVNEIDWTNRYKLRWITHTWTWLLGSPPKCGTLCRRAPTPVSTASVRTPSHTETECVCICYILWSVNLIPSVYTNIYL